MLSMLQFNLLRRFCGSSLKETIKCVMDRLFTNNTMSYLSMQGKNLGKIAFGETNICRVVIGRSRMLQYLYVTVLLINKIEAFLALLLLVSPCRFDSVYLWPSPWEQVTVAKVGHFINVIQQLFLYTRLLGCLNVLFQSLITFNYCKVMYVCQPVWMG